MNKKQLILSCVTLAFFAGLASQANAHDVTPGKTVKTATKATKTAKKTTAKKTEAADLASATPVVAKDVPVSAVVQQPVPVQQPVIANVPAKPANPYLSSQSTNPYLTPNPYLAGQQNTNPYLASRPANPGLVAQAQTSNVAVPVAMPQQAVQQAARPAFAQAALPQQVNTGAPGRRHISLSPLPVDIYINPGLRPAVAFSTPCTTIAKMTNNFPPIIAAENFMFSMVGRINESDALPFSIEPVCV